MAQTGFTPIQLYSSSTTGNTPAAADLLNSSGGSELAINIFDGKLFYKDSSGNVQVIGWKVVPVSAGGTGQTSYTDGQLLIGNSTGNTLTKATLTAGSGVTITNGAGAITINATGSGGTVTSVSGTAPVSVATGTTTPVISLASGYGDTQNPYASKTANYVLAAPNGSAGVPTFRALVSADIPSLSSIYIPYTGANAAIDLNAQTVVNIDHLGIGTTSVPTILLRAVGDNNSTSRIAVRGYSSNANSSAIRVTKFRGTVAAPQAPQSGDSLGKFELAGYGTTSSEGYPQASFEGLATEAWGATARGAKTVIKVTPNTTTTQVTAVTVDQDSKVTLAGALAVTGTTTLATSLSGLAKLTSGVVSTATSGTDYAPATSGTSILYGNGAGGFSNVTIGTGVSFAAGTLSATGTGGTVTSVAALTLGTTGTDLSSTVANGTTTPVITLNVPTASAANRGALSAADWTTFNGKYSVGGALGTPSSGTVTNLTGTASININGTVGATTPSTVVATTVSINGSGASQSLDVQSSTGANAIRIKGRASDGIGSFTFYDTTATTRYGFIQAAPTYFNIAAADTGAYLIFTTTGTERMRIPAAGGVQAVTTISVGNATPSASGAGITFPATQSASTDANTLDDYEEGTWTGTLKGLTTAGNSPTATGTYTKIGRLVMATINFSSVNTSGAAGILAISGLPFANSGAFALSTLVSNTASGSGSRASYATGTNIQALDGVLNDITIVASPVNVFTWATVTYNTTT